MAAEKVPGAATGKGFPQFVELNSACLSPIESSVGDFFGSHSNDPTEQWKTWKDETFVHYGDEIVTVERVYVNEGALLVQKNPSNIAVESLSSFSSLSSSSPSSPLFSSFELTTKIPHEVEVPKEPESNLWLEVR